MFVKISKINLSGVSFFKIRIKTLSLISYSYSFSSSNLKLSNIESRGQQSKNSELKQRHFLAIHVNQKWALFPFEIPWRYQICIARFLYSYRNNLLESLCKTTVKECWKITLPLDVFCAETPLLNWAPYCPLIESWLFWSGKKHTLVCRCNFSASLPANVDHPLSSAFVNLHT